MIELNSLKGVKGLKFCHINARSIVNKIDQFKLHFENSVIGVITVSESWLTEGIDSGLINIAGYQSDRVSSDDQQPRKGGGLITFIRSDLNFTVSAPAGTSVCEENIEVQRIELTSSVRKNILLYNVYRPPSGSVNRCFKVLSEMLEKENRPHLKELLILGDFNINVMVRNSPHSWQNRFGLTQIIKGKTRCAKNSSSTIDLMFTSFDDVVDSGIVDLHISDHKSIYLVKKKFKDCRKTTSFVGHSYLNYSRDLLSDWLTNQIKEGFRRETDPNVCWELMENFLEGFLNVHCPKKVFRSKENTPAWLTHDLINLAKDRDAMWVQAARSNSEADWTTARQLRNWSNNAVKAAKANYVKNELNNTANDSKKFWRNIKNVLLGKNSGNINITNTLNGQELPKNMQAQVINDFFANIGNKLDTKFGPNMVADLVWVYGENALGIDDITVPEVVKLVNTISMYKSSGLDNISSRVLKDFMLLAVREITHLFNLVINTGIFPDKWKIATVTPIPKVATATEPSDLRPISLLPVVGKLLDKYLTGNITKYLENNNYFCDSQFGFRKKQVNFWCLY